MHRPVKLLLTTAAIAVTGIGLATPALASPVVPADQTVNVTYPVSGSTFIKAINSSIALGPGSLSTTADLTTSTLTGTLSLPPATGSFKELGLVPVTATTEMIQDGQATGTVNFTTNAVTTTTKESIADQPEGGGPARPRRQLLRDLARHDHRVVAARFQRPERRHAERYLHHPQLRALRAGDPADQPDPARAG
jgi:hypothetical protein